MKICFKMNEILDFNLIVSFDLYEHVLATSLEKQKTDFPGLYSWSRLYFYFRIVNILLHHRNFFPRNPEISVRWFLLKSGLKQRWAQRWQGKRKQMGIILLRYQPSTFDFTEIVSEWKWKRGTVCHYVRWIF